MKILILNGHDSFGNGGAGNTTYGTEQKLNREFSTILKQELEQLGVETTIFNPSYTDKSMYTYLKKNRYDFTPYDLVLELHFNAGVNDLAGNDKITGTEILLHKSEKDTYKATQILCNVGMLGLKSRGIVYRSDLMVMNTVVTQNVPFMLWEIAFIDDGDDMKFYMKHIRPIAQAAALGLVSVNVSQEDTWKFVYTNDGTNLNIRSDMTFLDNIIGSIPTETLVRATPVPNSNAWYKVIYNGVTGYVVSKYLSKPDYATVVNVNTRLNVRKEPTTKSEVSCYLFNGDEVLACKGCIGPNGGSWYLVAETKTGKILGYCHGDYIRV